MLLLKSSHVFQKDIHLMIIVKIGGPSLLSSIYKFCSSIIVGGIKLNSDYLITQDRKVF